MVVPKSASLMAISPYFEPGAPPPTLPILLAQTELGNDHVPTKLLAQEELGPGPVITRSNRTQPRFTPYPKNSKSRHSLVHITRPNPTTSVPEADSSSESDSEPESESSTDTDSSSSEPLIPKPDGEAGRPGRGGYNLETALDWDRKDYATVKRLVKKLIKDHLDLGRCFSKQSLSAIHSIQQAATDQFPELKTYAHCWPVADMIRLRLKYTSSRVRSQAKLDAAQTGKVRPASKQKSK